MTKIWKNLKILRVKPNFAFAHAEQLQAETESHQNLVDYGVFSCANPCDVN